MLTKNKQGLSLVKGFKSASAVGGIKESKKPDVSLIIADKSVVASACFTKNSAAAAPVIISKKAIKNKTHRVIVTNSGNANCCTGEDGMRDAKAMQQYTADLIGCKKNEVLVCSTGVIGVPLPMEAVIEGINKSFTGATKSKKPTPAALGILTTDLAKKEVSYNHEDGYAIAGISKGSGMIHPNMATMLGFILTDAKIDKKNLTEITKRAVKNSFNRISVDNDESTNDTCIVLASGESKVKITSKIKLKKFEESITKVMQELAQKIVRDGEGASCFIEVETINAKNDKEANLIAASVCDSMLVKTAFAGKDPNWGRIVASVGYAPCKTNIEKISVSLNDIKIFSEGMGHNDETRPFINTKTNKKISKINLAKTIKKGAQKILIDINAGKSNATRWTSDLTHGYITINADYTT